MRYLIVVGGLLLVVGALVALKFAQISKLIAFGSEMEAAGPPPETVGSTVSKSETWERTINAVGSIAGVKTVDISNNSPGRVMKVRFESGAMVKKGEVLVELDTSVERAQLASARSRKNLAASTLKRSKALVAQNVATQAELEQNEAALETATTDSAAISAAIARKIVRAPFDGRLGIRNVNVGQYLNPGTMLTTLESIGGVFVDFTLPQQELDKVKEGMAVRVTIEGEKKPRTATLSAVSPVLDDATRSLKLRATVEKDADDLRPGMFVQVAVVLPQKEKVVTVPATAVIHASYGDSVFVVEPKPADAPGPPETPEGKPIKNAHQKFVRVGAARGDFVAILDGLDANVEVVTEGAFKLKNNTPIVIDNTLKLDPKLNPKPENR
jgi:membrane fusion protein (multidrug efflux system)